LCKLWREHADESVSFGAAVVSLGIGIDVLHATTFGYDYAAVIGFSDDEFDFSFVGKQMIVQCLSG
jgi:hypothetical protein